MKTASILFLCMSLSFILVAQGEPELAPWHNSFRYPNGIDETSHWTPGDVSFWTNTDYNRGANYAAAGMQIFDGFAGAPNPKATILDLNGLNIRDENSERISLDFDGLSVINGASWTAFSLGLTNGKGFLDLYNGSGLNTVKLGPSTSASNEGWLRLYGNNQESVRFGATSSGAGYGFIFKSGTTVGYIGSGGGANEGGRIIVRDAGGSDQAGMYVNSANQGILFADIKNFKSEHPKDHTKEIWYASLEGPEAGAYSRGTSTLTNGEVFIAYPSHFQHIANTNSVTVQLTSQYWDTFGLAVTGKTQDGFTVKELKGGTGNFSFDWEVKAKRKGFEDYEVVRDKMVGIQPEKVTEADQRSIKKSTSNNVELMKMTCNAKDCVHHK